ncbi:hypothetical protein D5b_00452 [Faustovirus]|nr:hypothetical protein D5b_00452 [Faustovirus]AMN84467.1 hypothetical protein D6_00056 [Faustovirus]AMP44391.1 hypothetical protein PRJ_Dakar_00440 [Faustovirus]
MNVEEAPEVKEKKTKNKFKRSREFAKYNPDEVINRDGKASMNGKRFKLAPKSLVGYITGREQYDAMVKYLQQKPVVSIDTYNFRMADIYEKIGKTSDQDDIIKICHLNNYMRRVDVELVYEDDM